MAVAKRVERKMADCVRIIKGNLLTSDENIIVHQVNCQGVMGAGIAKQIRNMYPVVYTTYKKFCPNADLLGKIQYVKVEEDKYIINLFGQVNYGTGQRQTDYPAVRLGIRKALDFAADRGYKSIGLPYMIGCGLAGGNETIIIGILYDELKANPKFDDMVINCYQLNKR